MQTFTYARIYDIGRSLAANLNHNNQVDQSRSTKTTHSDMLDTTRRVFQGQECPCIEYSSVVSVATVRFMADGETHFGRLHLADPLLTVNPCRLVHGGAIKRDRWEEGRDVINDPGCPGWQRSRDMNAVSERGIVPFVARSREARLQGSSRTRLAERNAQETSICTPPVYSRLSAKQHATAFVLSWRNPRSFLAPACFTIELGKVE